MKNLLQDPELSRIIWHDLVKYVSLPRLLVSEASENISKLEEIDPQQLKDLHRLLTIGELYVLAVSAYAKLTTETQIHHSLREVNKPLSALRSLFQPFLSKPEQLNGSDENIAFSSEADYLAFKILTYLAVNAVEDSNEDIHISVSNTSSDVNINISSQNITKELPQIYSESLDTRSKEAFSDHRFFLFWFISQLALVQNGRVTINSRSHKLSFTYHHPVSL